jgi:fructose-1,6-bisphosphatase/inositol monophosphatase family enzyme
MSEDLKKFLRHLASESGKVIQPYFGDASVQVERKGDESPVTIADRKAEETLRALINKEFPSHGIVGEEFGNENEDAEYVWVLDPIDGTISFTTGCPLFGTLIGLLHKGEPILGAIHQPILGQL